MLRANLKADVRPMPLQPQFETHRAEHQSPNRAQLPAPVDPAS
jgi:hypothetical protein